ncbi:MAG: polysaccharide deacetylase family protein [Deltaproteobacteria bacterium]|nr:polysaccharide deacetylase family protein [Deltaproteobacteria bacterium]
MLLPLLLVPPAIAGLAYLFLYGGIEGPIDWAMDTATHGSRDHRRIALTFDDGPDPQRTPALLDALAELDVRATFFLVGGAVDAHPELAARIAREGHEIGNHTYTHRYLPLARSRRVAEELATTDAAIERATGAVPALARPPYGGRSTRNVRVFERHAKRLVLWDVNSNDWRGAAAETVAARVLERTRPGSIILLHEARDGGEVTIDAVRLLVPALRARGFELTTAGRTLESRAGT